jgi:hypothetical protein
MISQKKKTAITKQKRRKTQSKPVQLLPSQENPIAEPIDLPKIKQPESQVQQQPKLRFHSSI